MLTRRLVLGGLGNIRAIPIALADQPPLIEQWRTFKSRFLSTDGRIIDNANGGVSHSEGQGWGMLFAVAAHDQASFDLILGWTARTLRRPLDTLHAWRYVPNGQPSIPDQNNAADGDMFIATALIRAGRLWGRPDHLQAAAAIARDILHLMVRRAGPFTVLLPGVDGFETRDAVIVNPSYYAFPMMSELAKFVPSQQWDQLQTDGMKLIETGRFGRWMLPPDWLRIGKTDAAMSPASGWPPRYSFDAVRVPLWWTWQKLPPGPAIQSIKKFWSEPSSGMIPAWADLKTDAVAPYPATLGMSAIMRLMRRADGSVEEQNVSVMTNAINYYDAALILLSRIAEREILPD